MNGQDVNGKERPFAEAVEAELVRARSLHVEPIHSAHEGYAVILEEL